MDKEYKKFQEFLETENYLEANKLLAGNDSLKSSLSKGELILMLNYRESMDKNIHSTLLKLSSNLKKDKKDIEDLIK